MDEDQVLKDTRHWVDQAVIGLNLCPFAKSVQVQGRVRYVVSTADTVEHLIYDLGRELNALHDADPELVDTTLLVHPQVLTDFLDYNDFLDAADALVEELGLDGELPTRPCTCCARRASTGPWRPFPRPSRSSRPISRP